MQRRPLARRSAAPVTLALALLASAGCGTEPEPEATGIEVTGPAARLAIGATAKLTATVQAGGGPLTGAQVTWTSRDTASVTVGVDGTATAVRPGESWIVGRAGAVTDSALVEVEFTVTQGNGRARIRAAGRELSLQMVEPYGIQSDYLGAVDQSEWLVQGGDQESDTIVTIYFVASPTGQRTALSSTWVPTDTSAVTSPAPIGYLEIYPANANTVKVVPLRGSIDAAIVQSVPAGGREGRMRARLIGSGRAWLGTATQTALTWVETQETFDVVADILPPFFHEALGSSSGQLTGTTPAGSWRGWDAEWLRVTGGGRNWVLVTGAFPTIVLIASPGTTSVDLGAAADSARAHGLVSDSARAYSGTTTGGRLEINSYTPAPANDLTGVIRGRVTLSGTGTTMGGAAVPFTGTIDFAAPVFGTPPAAAPRAGTPKLPMRRLLQGHRWWPRR
jgi:hypothetical protein